MIIFAATWVVAESHNREDEQSLTGGPIGTPIDELRCPKNLSGRGPVWNGIEVGISELEGVTERFTRSDAPVIIDPFFDGDYAPNYDFFTIEGHRFYACIVDGKVSALLIGRAAAVETDMPRVLLQWVSFLGEPSLTSWHASRPKRVLHWPEDGTSITFEPVFETLSVDGVADWIYFYPYQAENFEESWPVNNVYQFQPFPTPDSYVDLEIFDYEAIEATIAVSVELWPSATPRPTSTTEP